MHHILAGSQLRGKMEITITASYFTKRDMEIYTCHVLKL
jgi:hypothetical protein